MTQEDPEAHRSLALPAAALVFCIILAYAGSFSGAFLFDDEANILQNPFVRAPRLSLANNPAYSAALNTRPLVNLSLAANYAVGGFAPFGYHLVNLCVHLAAALFLFFSLWLLFRTPGFRGGFSRNAGSLAFFTTLLWALHPLQTESVTYVIQRCESLMGMFFLAAVFFSLQGWARPRRSLWHLAAVLCFFLGCASKEVMIAAPAVILAVDVVANRKGPLQALKESKVLYAGFALGLFIEALWLTSHVNPLAASSRNYTRWGYLFTQPAVLLHYVRLCFWPGPLLLDYYGWPVSSPATAAWTGAPALAALGFTAWALWRKKPAGLAGAWFFLILAPSSGLTPLNSMAAEHRMYLPLAAVAALVVLSGYRLAIRLGGRMPEARRGLPLALGAILCLCCAAGLASATWARNRDYRSEAAMWGKIVEASPEQPRARANFCSALRKEGRADEALVQCGEALRLRPGFATALVNIGAIQAGRGQYAEALQNFIKALESDPMDAMAANNIGATLLFMNRPDKALAFFERALAIKPYYAMASANMAYAHLLAGEDAKAAAAAQTALDTDPGTARAYTVLGVLAVRAGDWAKGEKFLVQALALDPEDETAKSYLGFLRSQGRPGG